MQLIGSYERAATVALKELWSDILTGYTLVVNLRYKPPQNGCSGHRLMAVSVLSNISLQLPNVGNKHY